MTGPIDISIVAPCYNEEATLREFVRRTVAVLQQLGLSHEIIIVDDGSRDRTLAVGQGLLQEYPQLKIIELSRNFGHQAAETAGMDAAQGRAVVLIDSDLQDPPEVIAEMVARWRHGDEVVYGQRRLREGESAFKIYTAKLFYRVLRFLTTVDIPLDVGDFRLMDRRVVDAVGRMREHHRFIRGLVSWVGFRQSAVLYDRKPRYAGVGTFAFRKMLLLSLDAITSFSLRPLRLLGLTGLGIAALAVFGAILTPALMIFVPSILPSGFPATFLLIMFLGGLNLFGLGIIGEYVGRSFEESKDRPIYVVRNTFGREPGEKDGDGSLSA